MSFKSPSFELKNEFSILFTGSVPSNSLIYLTNVGEETVFDVGLNIFDGVAEGVGNEISFGEVKQKAMIQIQINSTQQIKEAYEKIPIETVETYARLSFRDMKGSHFYQNLQFIVKEDRGIKFGYTSLSIWLEDVIDYD